jgi:hypothetical protein
MTRKKGQQPSRGAEIMAYRNGHRAGTHGRGRRADRANTRRKAIQEALR